METLDSDLCGGSYGRFSFKQNQLKSDVILVKVNLKQVITQLPKSIMNKQEGPFGNKSFSFNQLYDWFFDLPSDIRNRSHYWSK